MLKLIGLLNEPAPSRNNGSKLVSSKNNGNKLIFGKNNGNDEVEFNDDSIKHTKKSRKSKSQKLAKFQKLKSEKLSKCKNLSNFDTKKIRPSFLTPNAKTAFNHL